MSESEVADDLQSANGPLAAKEIDATDQNATKTTTDRNGKTIVLIPQPCDDINDPLNWPMKKKCTVFASITLAAVACQMCPNTNMFVFMEQVSTYHVTPTDMVNSVAAALAGWVAGPFLFIPMCAVIGRSAIIFWCLIFSIAAQIWSAKMTSSNDYVPFVVSRMLSGLSGAIPAILGSGYIIDLFYLHQRGKAFAVFEIAITFAVLGGGTLSGFIAEGHYWDVVFWWTLGLLAISIMLVVWFIEDTGYNRSYVAVSRRRQQLPSGWIANRIATFVPGSRTQPAGKAREWLRRFILPFQISFTPHFILTGTYMFVTFGLPVVQISTLATHMQPPEEVGGYGFSSLQMAFFTMTAWVGILFSQIYGLVCGDKIPLWIARHRGGVWQSEYRLANVALPAILQPLGLALWGIGLHYHMHYMVLALASFLIWFSTLVIVPVSYNYIVECFLQCPVETSVAANSYRNTFGIITLFTTSQWQSAVGIGWFWGMAALFVVFADILVVGIILKGHIVRAWTVKLMNLSVAVSEDGRMVSLQAVEADSRTRTKV